MSEERVGADVLLCPAEPSSAVRKRARPRRILQIVLAIAREIFEESAYGRYLSRANISSSPESYAAFRREYELMKARRPKCC